MLTIFTYSEQEGFSQVRNTATLRSLIAEKTRVTWVDMEKPTPEETELLDTCFNFHPLTIDDCLSPRHQPKIDNYGEYLFLIVHEVLPESSEREFKTAELDIFLGKNYLVTYHRPKLRSIDSIKERAGKNPKPLFRGADFLLASTLDEVVNLYNPVLDQFDRRITTLEDNVLQEERREILTEIFSLKRNLARLKRISVQQVEMLTHLIKDGYDEILPLSIPYLSNVRDHLIRISDLTDSHRDALAGLVEAHLLTSSNKANEVMKVLTMFASIMLPLTVITGIYGMNFNFMPEIGWKYGYLFALGLMVAVTGGLIYFFRRRKWL
jgi:magnesium transporter